MGRPEYRRGQAIEVYIARDNFMRSEVQGGRRYYTDYRQQSNVLLTMHDKFVRHAQINLANIAKKVFVY